MAEQDVFAFPARVSTSAVDFYYTYMTRGTLTNFAANAAEGRALLENHRETTLPLGYSYSGEVEELSAGVYAARVGIYIPRGLALATATYQNTNDLIAAIEHRTVRDISAGFYGGKWTCGVCGNNYWNYACNHLAGITYETQDDDGVVRAQLCVVAVDGAHLSEMSLANDGATPGAEILRKAETYAADGAMSEDQRRALERHFRVRLPDKRAVFALGALPLEDDMTDTTPTPAEGLEDRLTAMETRAIAAETAVAEAETRAATAEAAVAELEQRAATAEAAVTAMETRAITAEAAVAELEPLATDGRAWRTALIEDALVWGVRAQGERFPTETYRTLLAAATPSAVQEVIAGLQSEAERTLPTGRATNPTQRKNKNESPAVPQAAFM